MPKNDYEIGQNKDINAAQPGPGGGAGAKLSVPGQKAKDFKGTWKRLIAYMDSYMPAIIIGLILAIAGTVFNIVGPGQLRIITDMITEGITTGIDLAAIGQIGVILAVLYAAGFLFNYLQGFIMATVTQKTSKRLRAEISCKINRLPLRYFDSTSYGDVMSRVSNDVDTIAQTLNQSIGSIVSGVTLLLGTLITMLTINVVMTAAAVAETIIGFALMTLIISMSQKYFKEQQRELGRVNGHIEEIYAGHNVVKAYNGEEEAKKTFREINGKLQNSAWKSQFLSGLMMPLMNFMGNLGYVAVCVVGAVLAMNGSITFGVIVAFILYVRLFTQPLTTLAQAATNLQSAAAASERVFGFLDEAELENENEKQSGMNHVTGSVEFENVRFGYTEGKIVINDFSAEVKAGQKIAIVGPTGAGKTTMVNLLMRFYETNGGQIKIDGVPINTLTRENVHDLFSMVLQDTWLFEGTISENIVYNKEGVTDEQLIAACKAANIHHFIRTLPNGYDTVLGDNANLSVGQKQLITIARAMIQNAPMLILDEATSSVDTRTEILIQEAMDKLMAGRTSFVIAHRLSTIKNADLILVMKDGDIIESGNHNELLANNGFYAELYNSQFEQAA